MIKFYQILGGVVPPSLLSPFGGCYVYVYQVDLVLTSLAFRRSPFSIPSVYWRALGAQETLKGSVTCAPPPEWIFEAKQKSKKY